MNYNFFFQTGGRSLFLPFLVVILSLFACSKDKDTILSQHNLSFTVDGKNYSTESTALLVQVLNVRYVSCTAFWQPSPSIIEAAFGLVISSSVPVSEGIYEIDDECDTGVGLCAGVRFSSETVLGADSSQPGGQLTVQITSADLRKGGHITGTFFGILVEEDTGNVVNISNGKFDLPIE